MPEKPQPRTSRELLWAGLAIGLYVVAQTLASASMLSEQAAGEVMIVAMGIAAFRAGVYYAQRGGGVRGYVVSVRLVITRSGEAIEFEVTEFGSRRGEIVKTLAWRVAAALGLPPGFVGPDRFESLLEGEREFGIVDGEGTEIAQVSAELESCTRFRG